LTAIRSTVPAVPTDSEFEGRVLIGLGRTYSDLGLPAQAVDCFQAAMERLEALGDFTAMGALHFNLGVTYERQREFEAARVHLEKAAILYEAHEDLKHLGTVKRSLGILLINQGQPRQGAEILEQSLNIAGRLSDDPGRAQTLTELARVSLLHGDFETARRQVEEAIRLAVKVQDPAEAARAESVMAAICEREGLLDEAVNRYSYALREFERLQAADDVSKVSRDLAFLLMQRGEEAQAARMFAKAFRAQEAALARA
jgi:tetratricopeptide (TPR) repeat protein